MLWQLGRTMETAGLAHCVAALLRSARRGKCPNSAPADRPMMQEIQLASRRQCPVLAGIIYLPYTPRRTLTSWLSWPPTWVLWILRRTRAPHAPSSNGSDDSHRHHFAAAGGQPLRSKHHLARLSLPHQCMFRSKEARYSPKRRRRKLHRSMS